MTNETLYHITDAATQIEGVTTGKINNASLESEGFIHCCLEHQISGVLQRYYQNVNGLKLLVINPDRLDAKLEFENTSGGEELFPHIYGSINFSAVVDTLEVDETYYRQ